MPSPGVPFTAPMAGPPIAGRWAVQRSVVREVTGPPVDRPGAQPTGIAAARMPAAITARITAAITPDTTAAPTTIRAITAPPSRPGRLSGRRLLPLMRHEATIT